MRPKLKVPPALIRMQSKPMSMMRSNKTSVMSAVTTVNLVLSKLITVQVVCSGDQLERTYSCQMSAAGSNQSYLKINLYNT